MSKIKYVGETALNALVEKIKSITGTVTEVMRFVGSLKELPKDNTSYNKGDVILVGTKEYVLNETDGNKVWVEIGDEGLWLNKNTIEIEHPTINNNSTKVDLGSIDGRQIGFTVDFSNLVTLDNLNNTFVAIRTQIQSILTTMVIKDSLNAFVKKEEVVVDNTKNVIIPKGNTQLQISKKLVSIGGKDITITIDFTDLYSKIDDNQEQLKDAIANYDTFNSNFNNAISNIEDKLSNINKSYAELDKMVYKINTETSATKGRIIMNIGDSTPIATNKFLNQNIVLDTKKFVDDLKAEFINTGFVHDDSNTKTTFEEITYEEIEKMFK